MTSSSGWTASFENGLVVAALVVWVAYAYGVWRQRRKGRVWSNWRTLSFSVGIALCVVALLPASTTFAHHDLRGHMLQHLLLGMFAPLGLVLAAPVTLLLRSISTESARQLVRLLKTAFVRRLSHPLTALGLNLGGMYLLYFTPLYAESLANPWIHGWLHVHFIVAGCLFTWAIAGPDLAPERRSQTYRFCVLFVAMAAHGILAKAMFAYGWPRGTGAPLNEIEAAAKIMYYGGDLAEVLLMVALLAKSAWFRSASDRQSPVDSSVTC